MAALSKDKFLIPPKSEQVELPELGGSVTVRGMTSGEREKWETACYNMKQQQFQGNYKTLLISFCVMNGDSKPMFTAKEAAELPADIGETLFDAAFRLSKIGKKDIESLVGN